MNDSTDLTGGRNIAEYDWLIDYTKDGDLKDPYLHGPGALIVLHYDGWYEHGDNYGEEHGPAPALCGESGEWSIPGVGSRMSITRCPRCCELAGLPDGVGSPKNDDACRRILGMTNPAVTRLPAHPNHNKEQQP